MSIRRWDNIADNSAANEAPTQPATPEPAAPETSENTSTELRELRESLDALQAMMVPKRLMQDVMEGLGALSAQVENQQAERAQLHGDLQEARRDQVALLLNPGVKRLLALQAFLNDLPQTPELEHAGVLLVDAIEAFGYEPVEAEPGTDFDKKVHNSVGVEETEDEALDGKVVREVSPGYIYANAKRAAFPARVVVHKYV